MLPPCVRQYSSSNCCGSDITILHKMWIFWQTALIQLLKELSFRACGWFFSFLLADLKPPSLLRAREMWTKYFDNSIRFQLRERGFFHGNANRFPIRKCGEPIKMMIEVMMITINNNQIFIHFEEKQGKKVCKTTGFRSLSFSSEHKVRLQIAI